MKEGQPAWIETTFVVADHQAHWRVVVAGDVVQQGAVVGDVAGDRAFADAEAWIASNGLQLAGWKHAVDRAKPTNVERSTPTEDVATLRSSGSSARPREIRIETTRLARENQTQ